jgi:hypothetical protein
MLKLIATHHTTRFNMVAVPGHHALWLSNMPPQMTPHHNDVGAVREPSSAPLDVAQCGQRATSDADDRR